ncbi:universal stress protein [Mariniflexile jejuense]|uniref:Universal stress protein n=1 Tax=Mariniflexile jejuense TaxID=1173582 RepID=A0ABW3JM20_9FLAO
MKTILLPTDFSKNSINAINYAVELYKNESCIFYILNVQKASSFISDDMMVVNASATIYNTIVDAAKKSINNIIVKMKKHYNNDKHQFIAIVDYDNFIDSINQVSSKYNVDLIIMGTKGASGLTKMFFGSNTVKVIQRSNIPVLAIPEACKFDGLEAVGFTTSFKNLYRKEDFKQVKEIISLNNSKVHILHALCEQDFADELDKSIDLLKQIFKYPVFDYLVVKNNNVYETLHEFTLTNNIKLIAMLVDKHTFFERLFNTHTFETIAFNAEMPFLAMKKSED